VRVTATIDDDLIHDAQKATGISSKRELLEAGLRELITLKRRRDLLDLEGKLEWEGDLEAMRTGREFVIDR